jgi:hypothetical protein
MTTIAAITPTRVVIGVDTHKDAHVAVWEIGHPLGPWPSNNRKEQP